MPNIKNASLGVFRLIRRRVLIYAALILLIIIGLLIYHNHNKPHIASNSQEAISAPFLQQFLNSKDYRSYQIKQSSIADGYTTAKQYANAQTVLNEVIKNVPKDKIISETYRSFWYLYEQNGDVQNRKKYALLAAEKLKAEGDTQTAAIFEKDANRN